MALGVLVGITRPVCAAEGAALYRTYCARCHGPEARGDGPDGAVLARRPRNLREGFLTRYSTDELVARVRSAQPLDLTLDPLALGRVLDDVDAVTAHLRRLPFVDWDDARRGRALFLERCEGCHGPAGEGAKAEVPLERVPPDLGSADVRARLTGDRLVVAVRHRLPGMPGLAQVPRDDEVQALAAYVALLSPGYRTYMRYCAGCHGDDGRIAPDVALEERPKVVFDVRYFEALQPHELEDSATHMVVSKPPRMPHFARTLSEGEARAIVTYLRTLP